MARFLCSLSALLYVLSAGCAGSTAAQSLSGGARAAAMGHAATALPGEPWGQANSAAAAFLPSSVLSLFASEAFGLPELRLGALHLAVPLGRGAGTLGAGSFGYDAYRVARFRAGYARKLRFGTSRAFAAGLTLEYHRISAGAYGSAGAWSLSGGWFFPLLPDLFAGFQATNFYLPESPGSDALPRTISLGIGFRPDDDLLLVADLFKDVRFPASLRVGLELFPAPVLALRTGFTTEPSRYTVGTGFYAGPLVADVAAEYHHVLGWSPAFALNLLW